MKNLRVYEDYEARIFHHAHNVFQVGWYTPVCFKNRPYKNYEMIEIH